MKLRWTKRSQGDLVEIGRYISPRSNPRITRRSPSARPAIWVSFEDLLRQIAVQNPDELVGLQILLRLEPHRVSRRALDRRDDARDVGEVGVLVGDVDRRGAAGASGSERSQSLDGSFRALADEP